MPLLFLNHLNMWSWWRWQLWWFLTLVESECVHFLLSFVTSWPQIWAWWSTYMYNSFTWCKHFLSTLQSMNALMEIFGIVNNIN
jgi:hypothetical protein